MRFEFSLSGEARALLLTHPGLERGLAEEVKLVDRGISCHICASGGVVVRARSLDRLIEVLASLRAPKRMLVLIFSTKLERPDREHVLSSAEDAVSAFDEFLSEFRMPADRVAFRGLRREFSTLDRVFEHDFTSVDLARIVAGVLLRGKNVKVDLKRPSLVFTACVLGDLFFVGWDLLEDTDKRRKWRVHVHPAGLSPSAASCALLMRELSGTLYDPMCGCGTIPIEAVALDVGLSLVAEQGRAFVESLDERVRHGSLVEFVASRIRSQRIRVLASDVAAKYVRQARENLRALESRLREWSDVTPYVEFAVRDVLRSEPPRGVDRIVTNPPYGIRSGRQEFLPLLYRSLAEHAARSGAEYLDAFTARVEILRESLSDHWVVEEELHVVLGDLPAYLVLARRSLR